ncbi:MAG: site-specific integrase [Bacteroidales bacterium]|nr:site-specific integrase [Bacteroidales bacterium]
MKNDFILSVVWNKKGELKKDGTAPVFICVYSNNKRKYYNTKICIKKDDWDAKRQLIKKTASNAIDKNKSIALIKDKIEKHCFKMVENENFNIDFVFDCLNTDKKNDFILFVENLLLTDKNKTDGTKKSNLIALKKLKKFKTPILFKDVNYQLIEDYNNFLLSDNKKKSTIATYLKCFKAWTHNAYKKGLLQKLPFENYSIKMPYIEKNYLNENEFAIIENSVFQSDIYNYCRDVFCFGVYTGLRISDIIRLTPSNIIQENNITYIQTNIKKVNKLLKIPISELFNGKAIYIINKYKKNDNDLLFNILNTSKLDKCLNKIAIMLNIKHISIHTARHTFATILLNKGVNIMVVSKLLAHSNLQTTQIYAKLLDNTINDNLKNIKW